ncbi:hypothetical protein [uncultured Ruminococcus sp.]|uniref:hypothetical protein n=1 Tax=uncultured Ruminococcus sp. TaxID=165186 RepID=UPI0025EE722F|nr:hypothetical protein [uncultured Ruminococcus sp.]
MAWNEQYARILEQMKKNSITNTAITGADAKNDDPDCLFYTNFSRETAIAFYDVFDGFKEYYKSNPSIAIDRLKNNLKMQIEAMGDICPIEVLLYSSRIIRDQLSKRPIKQALISAIQQYIPDNLKSLQYILSGWEWPQILCIVIEACGKTNNDYAIKMAMDYCNRIAKKFVDKNDNDLLKSYITMIEYTQNKNYLNYITKIATIPQFEEDNALSDFLVRELHRNPFLKQYKGTIAVDIHAKTKNYSLKRSLEKIIDNTRPVNNTNAFNMNGLNFEKKAKQVEAMDFTRNTPAMLSDFERSREPDNEIILLICKKILRDISEMRPSDRNLALILVGTKGSRIHAVELTEPILNLQESHRELKVAGMIALTELDQRNFTLEDAMNQVIVDSEIDTWEWAVGKYFRYRKAFFEKNLMRAFCEKISRISKDEMAAFLGRFLKLIELFNGNNELMSTQEAVQKAIIEFLGLVLKNDLSENACGKLVNILDFMLNFCPNAVLNLLDELKRIVENLNYGKIKIRIDELIKKGDLAREPD